MSKGRYRASPGEARSPYRTFATEEDYQRHLEHVLGERLAKVRRALVRAERERDELQREVEELRRELHTGGTPLYPGGANPDAKAPK